jgi:alkylation response protein AidB-like acyl-CoA dehydrogenase
VRSFANDCIAPKTAKMDADAELDSVLLMQLFAQGLMGIETPEKYEGGGGMTFTQVRSRGARNCGKR